MNDDEDLTNVDAEVFRQRSRLKELRVAHRELDRAIMELLTKGGEDLRVRRLKKERLRLKDLIARLESALIPDLKA